MRVIKDAVEFKVRDGRLAEYIQEVDYFYRKQEIMTYRNISIVDYLKVNTPYQGH